MRLIHEDYDPFTGITEQFFWEDPVVPDGPGKFKIRRLQDVDHILALNKIMYNEHSSKKANYNDSNGLHLVAQIPLILIEQWMSEGFDWFNSTDAERKAKLNNRDNSKLLVRPGKL